MPLEDAKAESFQKSSGPEKVKNMTAFKLLILLVLRPTCFLVLGLHETLRHQDSLTIVSS